MAVSPKLGVPDQLAHLHCRVRTPRAMLRAAPGEVRGQGEALSPQRASGLGAYTQLTSGAPTYGVPQQCWVAG